MAEGTSRSSRPSANLLTTATLKRRPTLPGEMLLEEFLRPAGMVQVELAARVGVPIQQVNGIISGRRPLRSSLRPEAAQRR